MVKMKCTVYTSFLLAALCCLIDADIQECYDSSTLDVALQPLYSQLETFKNQLDVVKLTAKCQCDNKCEPTTLSPPVDDVLSSCRAYIEAGRSHGSGYYKIKGQCASGSSTEPLVVYCDQETNGGGWMRFFHKSGVNSCITYNFTWTGELISCLGLDTVSSFAVSDNPQTTDVENSWILNSGSWQDFYSCLNSPCNSHTNFGFPDVDVIANLANCKTPSGADWSQSYAGGYAFIGGTLATNGQWSRMFYGCNNYKNVGDTVSFRFGGGPVHTGEFVHGSCNDYRTTDHSITSRWNTDNVRAIWIKY